MSIVLAGVLAVAGINAVTAYAGSWKSHIVHVTTAYSKARVEDTALTNECWRSAGYVACDQIVSGVSSALIVFTYDAKHRLYHSYGVPPDGSPANRGDLIITGTTWTFPWQDTDKGKRVYVRIINQFTDPDTIQFREEYSLDNRRWIVTARGIERRTARGKVAAN